MIKGSIPLNIRGSKMFLERFGKINPEAFVFLDGKGYNFKHGGEEYLVYKEGNNTEIYQKAYVDGINQWFLLGGRDSRVPEYEVSFYKDGFLPRKIRPKEKGRTYLFENDSITSFCLRSKEKDRNYEYWRDLGFSYSQDIDLDIKNIQENILSKYTKFLNDELDSVNRSISGISYEIESWSLDDGQIKTEISRKEIDLKNFIEQYPAAGEMVGRIITQKENWIKKLNSIQDSSKEAREKMVASLKRKIEDQQAKIKEIEENLKSPTFEKAIQLKEFNDEYQLKIRKRDAIFLEKNLENFEDNWYVDIYDNQSDDPAAPPLQIFFRRHKLQLISKKDNGDWHLFLKDKPNCRLITDSTHPDFIKGCLNFLDTSSDPPEKFAIVPKKDISGSARIADKNESVYKLASLSLVESEHGAPYFMAPVDNKKLVPQNGEQLTYFAFLSMMQRDAAQAFRLLTEGLKSSHLSGTLEERHWLTQIYSDYPVIDMAKDRLTEKKQEGEERKLEKEKFKEKQTVFGAPGFLSVQLLAFYQDFKNNIETNPEVFEKYCQSKEANKNIVKLYRSYLQGLSNTPENLKLPLEVEYAVANYLVNYVEKDSVIIPENIEKRWTLLKNRQSLYLPKASLEESKERLEGIEVSTDIPVSIDFSHKINILEFSKLEIEKSLILPDSVAGILQHPDLFLAHFDYLASIASLKDFSKSPYSSYPPQLAKHIKENRDYLLSYISRIYASNAGKKLSGKPKVVMEVVKLLMIISSDPEQYQNFINELQGKPLISQMKLVNQLKKKLDASSKNIEVMMPVHPAIVGLPFKKGIPASPVVSERGIVPSEASQSLVNKYDLPEMPVALSQPDLIESTDLQIGAFRNEQERAYRNFYLKNLNEFLKKSESEFSSSLSQDIDSSNKGLKDLENNLLISVNAKYKDRIEHLKLLGQQASRLEMNDLIKLFMKGDIAEYERITGLDGEHCKAVHEQIKQWLILSTKTQQLDRIQQGLKTLKKHREGSAEYQDSLHKLGNTIYASRQYKVNEHPILLAFEHFENILLRSNQIATLEGILSKQNGKYIDKVFQLTMGGGKSKVLLPLSAYLRADRQRLCIVKVPKSLFNTNLADLGRTSNKLFGQKAVPFTFERNQAYTAQYFKKMHDRLMSCVLEGDYIVTTNTDMRALQLKYFDLLEDLKKHPENEDLWGQIEWLEKVLVIQKDCLDDEVDSSCNILQDLNYPFGEEVSLDFIQNNAIIELYQLLPNVAENVKTVKEALEFFARKSEDFTQGRLHELVDIAVKSPTPLFSKILEKLDESEKIELKKYLKNDVSVNQAFLNRLPLEDVKYLTVWKNQINHLLKSTLTKRANEKYGFTGDREHTPKDKWYVPIPYLASQSPKEGSEFANIYTTTNYTIQMMNLFGAPEEFTLPIIKEFQEKARAECELDQSVTIQETEAQKAFSKLTGLPLSLRDIDVRDENQIQDIHRHIKHRSAWIDYVLLKQIFSKVKMNPKLLNMNAVQEASMYDSLQGVSGTVWNWRSYHERLTLDEGISKGIDGQTLDYISKKPSTVLTTESASPQKIIDEYYEQCKAKHEIRAIIDIGALFNDDSNEAVANAIIQKQLTLEKEKRCKYVLYYNADDKLCAKLVSKIPSDPIVLESTDRNYLQKVLACTPEEWFTYYDQARSTGTDIPQALNGRALATVNKDTLTRDLVQGVMRMRDFYYGQHVDYILPKSVADTMQKPPAVTDILALCKKNQDKALELHHYLSMLRKIQNIYYQDLFNKLKKIEDKDKKLEAYQIFSKLFVTELGIDPIQQFSKVESLVETGKIIHEYHNSIKETWKKAASMVDSYNDKEEKELGERAAKIIADMIDYLPEKVLQSQTDQGVSVQAEAQRFTSQEKVTEQKVVQEQSQQAQAQIDQYRRGVSVSPVSAAEYSSWAVKDLEMFRGGEKRFNPFIEAMKKDQDKKLGVELFTSENYRKTFRSERDNTLEGRSKKPIQYILMRQQNDRAEAVIITQVEAAELQGRLAKIAQDKEPFVWIETPRATLYAGKRPEVLSENYPALCEQVNYFSGNLSVLEKHFDSNQWFNQERAQVLCQFFKEHIMQDELIRESSFANFEERILAKTPLPSKALSSPSRDQKERKEQFEGTSIVPPILHQYKAKIVPKAPIEILSEKLKELVDLVVKKEDYSKIADLLLEIRELQSEQNFTLETQMPSGQTLKKEIENFGQTRKNEIENFGFEYEYYFGKLMEIFGRKPAPPTSSDW